MGSGISALSPLNGEAGTPQVVSLKKLPDAIEESLYVHEKFPLVIDPTEQGSRFLKYQVGPFVNYDDIVKPTKEALNRALVSSMQNGRTMTVKVSNLNDVQSTIFEKNWFPVELLTRELFFNDCNWKSVLKPALGDPEPDDAAISQQFAFIICTQSETIPSNLASAMHVIKVDNFKSSSSSEATDSTGMDQIAALYGAGEIIRNSTQLVEAGFDGDLDELKSWVDKGFHIESTDGRKHTALSEASCQGHMHIVTYLIEAGADPNSRSDTGRSPLWRAAFNNHAAVVDALLQAGANPEYRDTVSMECAYDVCQKEDVRSVLSGWSQARTVELMDQRKKAIEASLEARIKTSAERELYAKNKLRQELVDKAVAGDVAGIKQLLAVVAEEAEKTGVRPRASVECRNETGQSLLSIAAQNDNEELAQFLLTYWKECDRDRWDLAEGELSAYSKIMKPNPNSRDMKGWTCVCICIFHESKKVLKLLLENGGDPNIRSSYNKNAWDLAKDDVDAAEKLVHSRAEIRQVLIDNDRTTDNKTSLFGNGSCVEQGGASMYQDLGHAGSPVVMNVEMNKEMATAAGAEAAKASGKSKPSKKKVGGGGGGSGGGKKK